MNPEIKAKWVAALRSGEYRQGVGRLKKYCPDGYTRHCCLGVLCEVVGAEESTDSDSDFVWFDGYSGTLPDTVIEKADLPKSLTDYHRVRIDAIESNLVSLNDAGKTFSEIADIIEREL